MRIPKGSMKIHESGQSCSSCYFWKSGEALEAEGYTGNLTDRGFCQRYPPGWVNRDRDALPIAQQPMTSAEDVCGEYKCKEKGGDASEKPGQG